jgi:hypothetical protein
MVGSTVEIIAKERLAVSRRALLLEMVVQTPVSKAPELSDGDAQTVGIMNGALHVKRPPLWRVLASKAIGRWWTHHPLVMAVQIAQPVLRPTSVSTRLRSLLAAQRLEPRCTSCDLGACCRLLLWPSSCCVVRPSRARS